MLRLAAIAALAAAAWACRPPCVQLAAKICECQLTTNSRDTCIRQAQDENGRANPTAAEEQVCADLVDKCDCRQLSSADGKRACGMAR